MNAAGWAGLGLQLAGGFITIFGFNQTMKDMVPGSGGLPIISHVLKSARWAKRKILRSHPQAVVGVGAAIAGAATVSAWGFVTAGPAAPIEEKVIILERNVLELANRIGEQAAIAGKAVAKVDERVYELQRQIGQLDASIKERIVGGKNGQGLQIAAAGVALAMIGTLISALGA